MAHYLDPNIRIPQRNPIPQSMPLSSILLNNEQTIRIPYSPRTRLMPYHRRRQRFAIIVAHRRFGKTVGEVNEDIKRIMRTERKFPVPQVAFISPTYAQGKRNAWQYAKHYTKRIPGIRVSEGELTITFPNGGRYLFVGSDNFDSLRGIYLDHASLDEYGLQDPAVWGEVIRPALADFKGGATFIGSAKGRNHFYDLLKRHEDDPNWYIDIIKASQTEVLSPEELADARSTLTEAQYEQEYECNFEAAVTGAFYGKEVVRAEEEGRISDTIVYDKAAPVYACWDIGISDHMALWTFQLIGRQWVWLNYYSNYNEDLPHYVNWSNSLPYRIKTHFLPHDAKQRDPSNLKTRQQFLEGLDLDCEVVPKVTNVNDRIQAVRMVFNRFWFAKKGTAKGVDCLRMYESEWKEKDKVLALHPKHNWASHGADALGTGVMGIDERLKDMHPDKENHYSGGEGWMG